MCVCVCPQCERCISKSYKTFGKASNIDIICDISTNIFHTNNARIFFVNIFYVLH